MAIGKRTGSGIAALLAAAVWLVAATAGAAEIRGWNFGDFGRILVDWGEPVGYRVVADGDPVVVEFDRPATGNAADDLAPALRQLSDFVAQASLSEDGRRLTLVPARPLMVNDLGTERGVVIDVWPDTAGGPAGEEAAETAAAEDAGNAGDTPGAPTPLVPETTADAAQPGRIGAQASPESAGAGAGQIAPADDGRTDDAAESQTADDPPADPPAPETADAAPQAPSADLPDILVRTGQHIGYSRVVFDWTGPVVYDIARSGNVVTLRFGQPAEADLRRAQAHRLDQVQDIQQTSRAGPLEMAITVAPATRVRHFAANRKVVIDVIAAGARVRPIDAAEILPETPAEPPEQFNPRAPRGTYALPDRPPRPARNPALAAAPPGSSRPEGPAETTPPPAVPAPADTAEEVATADGVEQPGAGEDGIAPAEAPAPDRQRPPGAAVFDPGIPAAAAVFERAGGLWVVFAAQGPFDVNALLTAGEAAFGEGEMVDARGGFAFRFPLAHDRHPQVGREGNAWRVAAVAEPTPPARRLPVTAEPNFALGPRLLIATQSAESLVRLEDPVVGDELIVVPLHEAGSGLADPRGYAQLRLPATAQGAVIDPMADGVEVRIVEPGIEITAASGLLLSPADDTARALMESPAGDVDRLFDVDGWRGPEDQFNQRRQALQRALVLGPEDDRERARLEFARFLFANGQATEALAQLEMLVARNPELAERLDFAALRGAANVLAGNIEAAMADLGMPELDESSEAALWRAAAAAQSGDWAAAARAFRRAGPVLYVYPPPLRERFLVWAAETWLNQGDLRQASQDLAWLSDAGDGAADELASVAYLRGRIAAARGNVRRAERFLAQAIDSDDSFYRHRAALELIDFQRYHERIEPAEEIERLEAIRYDWRGDGMEYRVLARLGDAYWRDGQYREGLRIWRETMADFPDQADAGELQAMVVERLRDLLAGEAPDGEPVSPLTAVTLYRDYQELIPEDGRRDRLIRHLAERLVQIDLLGEAGDLLSELVDRRLEGEDKARTGARLAAIRLLDDRPADAIAALDRSQAPFDEPALADERRLLRARALSEQDDGDAALALLQGDDSALAEAARLDIAWRSQNWPLAAEVLAGRIGDPPPMGEPMPEEQAEQVASYALALAMADDRAALDRLEARFGPAMEGTQQAETFALITRSSTAGEPLAGLAAVRRQVAEVDMFENFLETYRGGRPAPRETN
jgi:tetratricopeptide (TPR) repeat protein